MLPVIAGCAGPGGLTRAEVDELNMRGVVEGLWKADEADGSEAVLMFRADGMVSARDRERVRPYRINGRGQVRILNGEDLPTELQLRLDPIRLVRGTAVYRPLGEGRMKYER